MTVSALPIPTTSLTQGDRLPNFLLPDHLGKARWFQERAKGRPMLVLVDPTDESIAALNKLTPRFEAGGLDVMSIVGGTESEVAERAQRLGGAMLLLADANHKIRGAIRQMAGIASGVPFAIELDANQRISALSQSPDLPQWSLSRFERLTPVEMGPQISQIAPVLIIPDVLSAELCRALIERWHEFGHEEGTVHSVVDGNEVTSVRREVKSRRDHRIMDDAVLKPLMALIGRRVAPELNKAFAFDKFKFDRFVITCYDSERGDRFRRHRDNQAPSTADRVFAMTLNLNTSEYEGGELLFPEYGMQRYNPPTGGAILFSCSQLHEALPVTKGRRFTLLSFLRR